MIVFLLGFLFLCCLGDNSFGTQRQVQEIDGKKCECGLSSRFGTRIVGGERASIDRYPWMVGIKYFGFINCGAVLVSGCYVLTASHCVKKIRRPDQLKVVLGAQYRFDFKSVTREVVKIIRYPNYQPNDTHDDIALLQISPPVEFSDRIQPICLPKPGDNYEGKTVSVIGYGYTEEDGSPSNSMREVSLTVTNRDKCEEIFKESGEVYENNLCAGGNKGKDACLGDSGGPLIYQNDDDDGRYEVVGIVSWGVGCARDGIPGVYTQVNRYSEWINSEISHKGCCLPTAEDKVRSKQKWWQYIFDRK